MVAEVKMSSLSTIDALEILETIAMIKIPEYTESVLDPGPFEFVADLWKLVDERWKERLQVSTPVGNGKQMLFYRSSWDSQWN